MCYDFHFGISNEKEDVLFAIKLDLFSIGTIVVPIRIEPIFKIIYILDFNIAKLVPKQPIESVHILVINLVIPLDIIKQHLLKTFFHPKVGEMIIDKTLA
jgi:hypothetical protein